MIYQRKLRVRIWRAAVKDRPRLPLGTALGGRYLERVGFGKNGGFALLEAGDLDV